MTLSSDIPDSATSGGECAHCGLPVVPSLLRRHARAALPDEPLFCCGGCRLVHSLLATRRADQAIGSALLRIGLGIFFSMNLVVFSFCFYGEETLAPPEAGTGADAALSGLFRWLLLLLASGVMLTLWLPIAHSAWEDLRRGRLQAGLLITAGALAAYLVSALSVVRGEGPLYFDSASMILLLVTIGQYLEAKMKTAAVRSAEGRLLNLPDEATIETAQGDRVVAVADVRPEDIVRVAAGSAIPIDGEVVRGAAAIDVSLLTGESEPQHCEPGAAVWAGSHLIEGVIWLRASSPSTQRRVEGIVKQLHDLRREPTHIQRLADRIAAVFIPLTLALAVDVFAHQWIANGAPMEGVMRALAVALIACPCALGLTAPLVVSRAASTLAVRGVIVRSARALELAASIRHFFFDKTGTLTSGDFRVQQTIRIDPACDPMPIAAALERASNHPVARAWSGVDAAILPDVSKVEPVNGLGVRGVIDGDEWFIGRPDSDSSVHIVPRELDSLLPVMLTRNGEVVAWFGLAESIRSEAPAVLAQLESLRLHVEVLTGDVSTRAAQLAASLNLPVHSAMTPESKRRRIHDCRAQSNAPVAFVGDGVNDTLALAEADLGITVAGGSDLAHASGQVSLLEGDLHRLIMLLRAARIARRRIALSLTWSFGYNSVGITLAALGLLTPVFAAIAMVLSSAVTILIATRSIDRAIDRPIDGAIDDQSPSRAPSPLAVSRRDSERQGAAPAPIPEVRPA